MKNIFKLFFCISVSVFAQKVESAECILQIEKIPEVDYLPKLKILKTGSNSWKLGTPTFEIKDSKSELAAKGWMAMTTENLHIYIEVTDNTHLNTKQLGDIWNGDGIQIGIDTEGDGAAEMPKETPGMVGSDAGIGLVYGKNGAEGFAWFLGGKYVSESIENKFLKIKRIESKKLTVYEAEIPWKMLKLIPGTYSKIGFAIQINDTDNYENIQNTISWGKGAGGEGTPGLFEQMAVSQTFEPFSYAYKQNNIIWKEGEYAEICFSVASMQTTTLIAFSESIETKLIILPNKNLKTERYSIKLFPKNLSKPCSLTAYLLNNKYEVLNKQIINLAITNLTLSDFNNRIDSLIAVPNNHFLFDRHLHSVKALVLSEWSKLNIYKSNKRAKNETYKFIYDINEGIKYDASKWEKYLLNERTLTFAYISKRDGTLQYYSLDLPKKWDSSKKYPLFYELHGSGNPHVLSTLQAQLGFNTISPDLSGYTSNKSYMQVQGIGYHVVPFGRGNSRYIDIGEIDVFEALEDVKNNFKIDEDRCFLYGFSMGGGGTWSLGMRTPDLWAAIGIFAGGIWNEKKAVSLGRNLVNTPVFIWCGDKDGLFSEVKDMQNELEKHNIKPYVKISKNIDHKYPDSVQVLGLNWMMQYHRKRPHSFSFTADNDWHLGVWGITMTREESVSCLPSFDCTINNQTVSINSNGTSGLKIILGEKGLKMNGKVEVIWNGKKEYEGEIKDIEIGKQLLSTW